MKFGTFIALIGVFFIIAWAIQFLIAYWWLLCAKNDDSPNRFLMYTILLSVGLALLTGIIKYNMI